MNNSNTDNSTYSPIEKRTLYPSMGSLQEVTQMGIAKLPITTTNTLVSILNTYHNTLLDRIREQEQQ